MGALAAGASGMVASEVVVAVGGLDCSRLVVLVSRELACELGLAALDELARLPQLVWDKGVPVPLAINAFRLKGLFSVAGVDSAALLLVIGVLAESGDRVVRPNANNVLGSAMPVGES